MVAKVDNPGAVAAMLRHPGLDQDPNPDPTTLANECGPKLDSHSTLEPERFAYMLPIAARERQRCDHSTRPRIRRLCAFSLPL